MKPGYFERHLGETTLRATSLDLRSEDYEFKTSKPLLENPCCYSTHRCVIDTFVNRVLTAKEPHQDGRRKLLSCLLISCVLEMNLDFSFRL